MLHLPIIPFVAHAPRHRILNKGKDLIDDYEDTQNVCDTYPDMMVPITVWVYNASSGIA